ncbi:MULTISPECIES: flagellar hook protein FlgE [Azonexaceae]|uniref:flagellar hook protein FlgE n=1 Tax=Azonexaceae TaxID=2008795 RepID=UPI001CF81004|nr:MULTISPECIES: flagellar hook protein FlgE [Azonexaceae]UCV23760.1 flagellar hook protein FlgE [Ferribacterium limneticum]
MAFQQGLSGLASSSKALDVAGNNIANASTVGFKSSATHFADVYGASLQGGGGSQIGIGSTLSGVLQQYTQGNITATNNPLDIAINGTGFFGLTQNGSVSYSRNGQFHLDKDGFIINDQNRKLLGVLADSTGSIPQQPPTDQLKVDFVTGTPNPTSTAGVTANLDSRQTQPAQAPFDPTDPDTYNSSTAMTVYDSLGNPHTLSYYFLKTATPNQWTLYTRMDGVAPTVAEAAGTVTFNSSGVLTSAGSINKSYAVTTGAVTPLAFDIDVSNMTQFGSPFAVNDLTQNGFAPGNLAGVSVSKDGIVQARYDNGQTRDIGQVALFNFRNPNGLSSIGNNQWSETADSGQPTPGNPNTGIFGVLQASAVEESNVDLTAELVNLIVQQRNYQASAQSIKTQDQILQTLVNIR